MQISDKRRAANRANSQNSTGPKNLAPRRKPAKFEILANAILVVGESRKRFIQLLNSLHDEFAPQTPSEFSLVEKVGVYQWLILRSWTLESAAIAHAMHRQTESTPTESTLTRIVLARRSLGDEARQSENNGLDRQHHRAILTDLRIKEQRNFPAIHSQLEENKEPDPETEAPESH